MNFRIFLLLLAFAAFAETAAALDYVRFRYDGKERNEEGRILERASDGILFQTRDGQLFGIRRRDIITRKSDDVPFVPYTKMEMIERLKKEIGEGYNYLDNYDCFIIVYTTSKPFATWYGNLLKKIQEQYTLYWKKQGVQLAKPEFLMVAVVLSSEERFRQFVKQEGSSILKEQCAYYHMLTNRIAMYDMSGQQAFQEGNQRRINSADIQRFLTQPGSYRNIMTVAHEAVHQVGFNTGMHLRHVPGSTWVHEGLAIFHEVPDSRTRIDWTIGPHVNRPRLDQLRRYMNKSPQEPVQKMITDDTLFKKTATALDNYALAWGVMYYLNTKRSKELAAYLKILQEKTLDSDESNEIRMKDFESCFGSDWDKFYRDFADFIRKL